MDPLYHSKSSQQKWGGSISDYMPIHHWFDESKNGYANPMHRAMRHHSQGIGWCIDTFGRTLTLSNGKDIPVRYIAERHIIEDCGRIPTMKDWLINTKPETWMLRVGTSIFSQE